MQLKFGQNIIDKIKGKKSREEYKFLRETVSYISQLTSIELDKNTKNRIYDIPLFPQFYIKNDKNRLLECLNNINISKLPKATEILYKHQQNLLDFAKELLPQIEQEDISPLLIDGTLLGAIRHGGFIPWDDDIDFDLMREDFDKLREFAKKNYIFIDTNSIKKYTKDFYPILDCALKQNPNKIIFAEIPTSLCAYRGTSLEDVLILDFFPRDYINPKLSEKDYIEYRKKYGDIYKKFQNWGEIFDFYKNELLNEDIYVKDSEITAKGWGSYGFVEEKKPVLVSKNTYYPFKKIEFEGIELDTINRPKEYLTKMYQDYNSIPLDISLGFHIKELDKYLKKNNRKYYIEIKDILKEK